MMIRQMLEECQRGFNGVGFNEVVVMVSNSASSAEVYMMLDDVRFTEKGNIVTFMGNDGTHLHLKLEQVREVQLVHKMNEQNLPSYSVWFNDEENQPLLRIYLRKSEQDETNPPRHDLFMRLIEKYGTAIPVGA